MKNIFIALILFSLSLTAQKKPIDSMEFFSIDAIDFNCFKNPKYQKYYPKNIDKKEFLQHYFNVWNVQKQPISKIEWTENFTYKNRVKFSPCYAENFGVHPNKIIDEIKQNLPTKKQILQNIFLGITLKTTDIRYLPTKEFCFKNIRNAGESYSFDYFQSSTLWIGAPVSILAISNDGLWYFINSHNNKGWVEKSNIAIVDKQTAVALQKMDFAVPINDKVIVKNTTTATKIYIGTVLPVSKKHILIPKKNFANNKAVFDTIPIKTTDFKKLPIPFSSENVKHILTELHHHKYTWGGINEGRDCSSTIKDFLTPFGIWLPRNSGMQKTCGKQISLTGTPQNKLQTIITKGIPFLSTVYKKGHIMLYVGKTKTNKPAIFHNVWGVKAYYTNENLSKFANNRTKFGIFGIHNKKTKNTVETRFNIGKAVFTNIEPSAPLNKFKNLTTESYLENYKTLTLLEY